jgi:hypothetical protein
MPGVTSLKRCQSRDQVSILGWIDALRVDALDGKLRAGESQEILQGRPSRDRCVLRHGMDGHEHHRNGITQAPL